MNKKNQKKENKKNDYENSYMAGKNRYLKEILKLKRYWGYLVLFLITSYATLAVQPFMMGKIIDNISVPEVFHFINFEISYVYLFLFLMILFRVVEKVSDIYVNDHFIPIAANKVYKSYSLEMFSNLISYPTSFFKSMALGKMTHIITTSINTLPKSLSVFSDSLGLPVMFILSSIMVFFISWQMGLFMATINIIYGLYYYKQSSLRKKLVGELNNEKKNISKNIVDDLNFSIEIKKNNKEKKVVGIISSLLDSGYQESFTKKKNFEIKNSVFMQTLWTISLLGTFLLLIYLYRNNLITAGGVTAVIIYTGQTSRFAFLSIKTINELIEEFTIIGDGEKLLLHMPENYSKGKTRGEVKGEIEYKNLDFSYEAEQENSENFPAGEKIETEKKVFSLSNINLKIKKGSKVAFVGKSGGGKSTAVELIGGFYFPNKGEILVDGVSTQKINLNDLRSSIAYVSQDIAIFNTTIGKNISYGLNKDISEEEEIKEIKKASKVANISEFIETLPDGYDTKVGEKGLKLSGGQKQRIAIARAILRDPKILILDEPTSALDIESEKYITKSLKTLMRGRTTIIIAHRLSTIIDADKIFVFKEGQIIEEGNYKKLISQKGRFKKMVDLHNEIN